MQTAVVPALDSAFISLRICNNYLTRQRGERWVCFSELRSATGYAPPRTETVIDLWAMDLWPSGDHERIAFEIKVSRSDFLRELKDPRKRKLALMYSNRFYFATPQNLVTVAELPPEAGLVEVRPDGSLVWKVAAPYRDTDAPTWRFMASVARRVQEGRVLSGDGR